MKFLHYRHSVLLFYISIINVLYCFIIEVLFILVCLIGIQMPFYKNYKYLFYIFCVLSKQYFTFYNLEFDLNLVELNVLKGSRRRIQEALWPFSEYWTSLHFLVEVQEYQNPLNHLRKPLTL